MILLLDTSTPICHLTLVDDAVLVERQWDAGRTLAKGLLSYIEGQLAETGCTLNDLEAIGVFSGPGSYTGLRIGMTVVNTLADCLGIPIVSSGGVDWSEQALERLRRGENDILVMPFYGSEATITTPRK